MKANEVVEWLKEFGADGATIPAKTLKRWAVEGIIAKPVPARLPPAFPQSPFALDLFSINVANF